MKVIITFTFCCDNLYKSTGFGSGKSLEPSGEFCSPTLWSPYVRFTCFVFVGELWRRRDDSDCRPWGHVGSTEVSGCSCCHQACQVVSCMCLYTLVIYLDYRCSLLTMIVYLCWGVHT